MKCPNCGHEFEPDEDEEKKSKELLMEKLGSSFQLKNLNDPYDFY